MKLSHFPPDILSQILSPTDSSYLCIRLWNTGDRLLQHRLASVMTSLDWEPSNSLFQIPSAVYQLPRLRHFAIKSREPLSVVPLYSSLQLRRLPPSLESLELDFCAKINLLVNQGMNPPVHLRIHYPRGVSRYIDLNELFPRLTSLTLGNIGQCPPITPSDLFPALPATLTELCMSELTVTPTFASMLPRSLIKLVCSISMKLPNPPPDLFETAWCNAPPHLEYIKHVSLSRLPYTSSWLPKSITTIDSCSAVLDHSQDFYLPTKTLVISNYRNGLSSPFAWTSRLPQTLINLFLFFNVSLPPSQIHCLPTSLTLLKTSTIWSNQDLEDAKKLDLSILWPPALTYLKLNASDFVTLTTVLPPHLKVLNMSGRRIQARIDMRALPPLLHTLTTHATPQLIEHLPNNLKSLSITSSTNFEGWPTFPDSLTEFTWNRWRDLFEDDDSPIIGDIPLLFPSQLRSLRVEEWRSAWFHVLPRTVTDLNICKLFPPSKAIDEPDHFAKLPNLLTRLHLKSPGGIELSPTSLAHLCNLIDLETHFIDLPSAAIAYLPRTMKSLTARLAPFNPSMLRFLPLSLTRCNLELKSSVSGAYDYWPLVITHLLPKNRSFAPRVRRITETASHATR